MEIALKWPRDFDSGGMKKWPRTLSRDDMRIRMKEWELLGEPVWDSMASGVHLVEFCVFNEQWKVYRTQAAYQWDGPDWILVSAEGAMMDEGEMA